MSKSKGIKFIGEFTTVENNGGNIGLFKNRTVYLFNITAFKTCFVNPLDYAAVAVRLFFDGYICRRSAAGNTVSFTIFRIVDFNFKICNSFFKHINSFWQIFNSFPLIPFIKNAQQRGNVHESTKVKVLQGNAPNFTDKGREITLPYFNKIGRRNEHISFIIRRCAWLARSGNGNFIATRQFVFSSIRQTPTLTVKGLEISFSSSDILIFPLVRWLKGLCGRVFDTLPQPTIACFIIYINHPIKYIINTVFTVYEITLLTMRFVTERLLIWGGLMRRGLPHQPLMNWQFYQK